ncbi:MAG: T9SS type A sorting domain-containing protein [Candidatus Kapabacteria bacterium]|nr:T9SS type A sorting domain-containing protein [Candidatus Kapabacteria bacterium]
MRAIQIFFIALLVPFIPTATLISQPMMLDERFGDGGRFITSVSDYSDYALSTTPVSDAGTLTCGFYIRDIARPYTGAGYLMKVRANGMLDNRFGNSGFLRDTLAGTLAFLNAVEMPNGNILLIAGGQISPTGSVQYPILYRLLPTGRPDTNFGNGGRLILLDNPRTGIGDIRRMSDGKYIVSCSFFDGASEFDAGLMRLNMDGTPDSTFGINGFRVYHNPILYDLCEGMELQPDGKVVMICRQYMKYDQSVVAIYRMNSDGSVDSSFGTYGKVIVRSPLSEGYCAMTDVLIQPDGRIITTGYAYSGSVVWYTNIFMIARYMPDGRPDSSFGTNGIAIHDIAPGEEHSVASALQPDGKILILGNVGAPFPVFQSYSGVVRLLSDGRVDSSFGVNGVIVTDLTGTEGQGVSDIHITPDNGFMITGHGYEDNWNGYFNLVLVKYSPQFVSSVELQSTDEPFAYPNPATTHIRIAIPTDATGEHHRVTLFDMLGNAVAESTTGILHITNLAAGQYMVRMEYETSTEVAVKYQTVMIGL